jgi:hypothetical protein
MYVICQFLVASVIVSTFMPQANKVSAARPEPGSAPRQEVVSLAPFSSVESRGGGKVWLRHGPTRSVTFVQGSPDYTQVMVADAGRLVIDKCKSGCPRGYELEIEIVTPHIANISAADGGTIQSRGSFPRQTEIGVAVSQGGTIDIRSIEVDSVNASVTQGGRILTSARVALSANILDGGNITYWGGARVTSSLLRGGDVAKGAAAEAGQPLSEFGPLPAITMTPATPPSVRRCGDAAKGTTAGADKSPAEFVPSLATPRTPPTPPSRNPCAGS